jgi:hypothetical protein
MACGWRFSKNQANPGSQKEKRPAPLFLFFLVELLQEKIRGPQPLTPWVAPGAGAEGMSTWIFWFW